MPTSTCRTPALTAAAISSPVPAVLARIGSLCCGPPARSRPDASAISTDAVTPSSSRNHGASTRSPSGPWTRQEVGRPPRAAAKPSPPSDTGAASAVQPAAAGRAGDGGGHLGGGGAASPLVRRGEEVGHRQVADKSVDPEGPLPATRRPGPAREASFGPAVRRGPLAVGTVGYRYGRRPSPSGALQPGAPQHRTDAGRRCSRPGGAAAAWSSRWGRASSATGPCGWPRPSVPTTRRRPDEGCSTPRASGCSPS